MKSLLSIGIAAALTLPTLVQAEEGMRRKPLFELAGEKAVRVVEESGMGLEGVTAYEVYRTADLMAFSGNFVRKRAYKQPDMLVAQKIRELDLDGNGKIASEELLRGYHSVSGDAGKSPLFETKGQKAKRLAEESGMILQGVSAYEVFRTAELLASGGNERARMADEDIFAQIEPLDHDGNGILTWEDLLQTYDSAESIGKDFANPAVSQCKFDFDMDMDGCTYQFQVGKGDCHFIWKVKQTRIAFGKRRERADCRLRFRNEDPNQQRCLDMASFQAASRQGKVGEEYRTCTEQTKVAYQECVAAAKEKYENCL